MTEGTLKHFVFEGRKIAVDRSKLVDEDSCVLVQQENGEMICIKIGINWYPGEDMTCSPPMP